jgi:hypothetical protein
MNLKEAVEQFEVSTTVCTLCERAGRNGLMDVVYKRPSSLGDFPNVNVLYQCKFCDSSLKIFYRFKHLGDRKYDLIQPYIHEIDVNWNWHRDKKPMSLYQNSDTI